MDSVFTAAPTPGVSELETCLSELTLNRGVLVLWFNFLISHPLRSEFPQTQTRWRSWPSAFLSEVARSSTELTRKLHSSKFSIPQQTFLWRVGLFKSYFSTWNFWLHSSAMEMHIYFPLKVGVGRGSCLFTRTDLRVISQVLSPGDNLMNKSAFYKYMLQALLYHLEPLL